MIANSVQWWQESPVRRSQKGIKKLWWCLLDWLGCMRKDGDKRSIASQHITASSRRSSIGTANSV